MKKTSDQDILEFLSYLRSASRTGYVSGQHLARQAGISRSAVWKQVLRLKQFGYGVESLRGRGYKLVSDTLLPVPWELKLRLRTKALGRNIIYLNTTRSTQDVALSIADTDPQAHGTVVIAGQQKSGRGRLKRKWFSPSGGLWFSIIVRPEIHTAMATLLPFAAALAVQGALVTITKLEVRLKWPNDIMITRKKVAGILLDISAEADSINYAVIGAGINVNIDAADVVKGSGGSQEVTTIRSELGHDISMLDLIKLVLEKLEGYLGILAQKGGAEITEAWKKNTDMIGRNVVMSQNGRILHEGIATDLGEDGSLVVETMSGKKVRIASGDVRVRY